MSENSGLLDNLFGFHKIAPIVKFSACAINGPQIIEFLHALGQQIRQPLLVIWDGLAAHRSALEYLEALNGAVQIEQLPPTRPN